MQYSTKDKIDIRHYTYFFPLQITNWFPKQYYKQQAYSFQNKTIQPNIDLHYVYHHCSYNLY